MRLTRAVLVIVDISGYTSFIKYRAVSLLHAEQIITDLLDAVLEHASHPMRLNKLEGDAALLFAETQGDEAAAVRDVVNQVQGFFAAFAQRRATLTHAKRHCQCDACANLSGLGLKAFVHVGEIAIKQVRQFEELAGEEVILIHRLLKNRVPEREYVLLTQAALDALDQHAPRCQAQVEEIDGMEAVTVHWFPALPTAHVPTAHVPTANVPTATRHTPSASAEPGTEARPVHGDRRHFHHVERVPFTFWQRVRESVALTVLAVFGKRRH
jgi:hypothetical protein